MIKIRILRFMLTRPRRITRQGVICRDRNGRYNGYTWRVKIAVCGAGDAQECVRWMKKTVTRRTLS